MPKGQRHCDKDKVKNQRQKIITENFARLLENYQINARNAVNLMLIPTSNNANVIEMQSLSGLIFEELAVQ